ncbi:MAG: hypothetical protein AAGD10_10360 [Myxococcota bacterium]
MRAPLIALCALTACGGSSAPGGSPDAGTDRLPSGGALRIVGPDTVETSSCLPFRMTHTATGTAPLRWFLEGGGAVGLQGGSTEEGVFDAFASAATDGQGRSGTVAITVEDAEGRQGRLEIEVRRTGAPHWLSLQRDGGFDFIDQCRVLPQARVDVQGNIVDARVASGWLAYLVESGTDRGAFRVDLSSLAPGPEPVALDGTDGLRIRPVGSGGWVLLETADELRLGRDEAEGLTRPLRGLSHFRVGSGATPRVVVLDGVMDGLLLEPERGRDTELLGIRDAAFGDDESLLVEGVPGLGRIDLLSREQVFFQSATLAASSPRGRWVVEAPAAEPLRFVPSFSEGASIAVEAFAGRPQITWGLDQRLAALRVAGNRWATLLEVGGQLRRLDFETGFASSATVTAARYGPVLALVTGSEASIRLRRVDGLASRSLPVFDRLALSPSGALVLGDTQGIDRVIDSRNGETVLRGLGPTEVEAQAWSRSAEVLLRVARDGAGRPSTWVGRFDRDGEAETETVSGWPLGLGLDPVLSLQEPDD